MQLAQWTPPPSAYVLDWELGNSSLTNFTFRGDTTYYVSGAVRPYGWIAGAWVLTNEIHFIYDGKVVVQERHFAPQLSTNTPQQLVTYTRGRDLSGTLEGAGGIGGLLARSEISNLQSPHALYHADGNGNVTCLIGTNTIVLARYLYDPYGNILSQSGSLADANLYRFSSKEWHVASGLVYYGYRFYAPELQRWANRDPIGDFGFEALRANPVENTPSESGRFGIVEIRRLQSPLAGMNLFAFVGNLPLTRTDLFGLSWWGDTLTAAERSFLRALRAFRVGLFTLDAGIACDAMWNNFPKDGDCLYFRTPVVSFAVGVVLGEPYVYWEVCNKDGRVAIRLVAFREGLVA